MSNKLSHYLEKKALAILVRLSRMAGLMVEIYSQNKRILSNQQTIMDNQAVIIANLKERTF